MRRLSIRARLLLAVGVVVLVNVLATAVVISVTSDQLLDQIDERLLAAAEDSSGVDGPASGVVTVGDVYSGVLTPDGQLVTLHAVRNRGQLFPPPEVDDVRIGVTANRPVTVESQEGSLEYRMVSVDSADGVLVLALNIPALVTIILCYIWFGLTEAAAVTAVAINKIPTVTVLVREGARDVDRKLLEVAAVYKLPRLRTLTRVYLPQLYPYFMAAARSGLALIWKIVLVVELLGRSSGVGFQLGTFFQFFDITAILAYTIAFAVIVLLIEALIMRPLDARISRGRA